MLTRAVLLATGWLLLSFLVTLAYGTRLRSGSMRRSALWLLAVIGVGDLWAVATFGLPHEMLLLSGIAFVTGYWWIRRLPDWNALGQVTWAMLVLATVLYFAYSFAVTAFAPLHPVAFIVAVAFFFVEVVALGLALTYAFETLDVCCRHTWRRRVDSFPPVQDYTPKVSLHVPAYNEPPAVVEATLRQLAKLDYPNYEILLIDNNTPDEAKWRPLEAVCWELGPRFRCLHLDNWPGYKSGALNFALAQTAPDAEIIGIIDADYQVEPGYLRDLVPAFADPEVAFVQTPQDYRDYKGNAFLRACYHAYKYFFDVSMASRNERNAIIFGGTMGLIRSSVLREIGGWDEWCITEDAEASLRILKRGYTSFFVNKTYGRGLMPFTFEGLKKQRFRWCFGGIQILKKHVGALMPWARTLDPDNHLTAAQRYHYLVGGLQWFNEPVNLFFAVFLVFGGLFSLLPEAPILRPLRGPLIVVPALLLIVGIVRFLWALRHTMQISVATALAALGNFFSLGWSVTLGCIQGLLQPEGVFLRTPKTKSRHGLIRAVRATQWETSIGTTCALTGSIVLAAGSGLATLVLGVLLLWQACLYLAAPAYSLLSIEGERVQELFPSRADVREQFVWEGRAARVAIILVLLFLLGGGLYQTIDRPSEPATYTRFQPAEVPAERLLGLNRVPMAERGRSATLTPTATPTEPQQTTPTIPSLRGGMMTPRPTPSVAATPTGTTPASVTPRPSATATTVTAASATPTSQAAVAPTMTPTTVPPPTQAPTTPPQPTQTPTTVSEPTPVPTQPPTETPRPQPTATPQPAATPTDVPEPTQQPTQPPSEPPTATPVPTRPAPTESPAPTEAPTEAPAPTAAPTNPPQPTQPSPPT